MQDINPASCSSPEETIEISVSPAEQIEEEEAEGRRFCKIRDSDRS
jgi:hypothetical protein